MISRRSFIAASAASLMLGTRDLHAQAAAKQFNIVLILADDLGYGDLGCYGGNEGVTPSIDQLAKEGKRFTDAYTCAPVCAPARAGLMTGRYPQRFGFEFNPFPRRKEPWGISDSERLLSEELKEAGYTTALVGKWHLGPGANQHPMKRGFDEFFGFIGGKHRYVEDEKRDANGPLLRGMEEVSEKEYLTEAFAREACSFIERNKARPFFLYLAPNAVHVPLQAPPEKYLSRVKGIADEARKNQLGILAGLDGLVGVVRAKLKELGLAEKTLVVFMSDNGGAVGNKSKNGKLRGVKTDLFEGGIRVPLIAALPGRLHALVDQRVVSIIDLYQTILNAANVNPNKYLMKDGADFLSGRKRHEALFWRYGPEKAVRSGNWKLMQGADGVNHLFDLAADMGELHDLSEAEPARVKELLKLWKKWDVNNIEPKWEGYQKNEQ